MAVLGWEPARLASTQEQGNEDILHLLADSGFLLRGSSHKVYVKMLACACLGQLSFIPPKETWDMHFFCNATPIPGWYFLKKFTENELKLMLVKQFMQKVLPEVLKRPQRHKGIGLQIQ